MANLKRYITGIICCLCSIFLMSNNVGAIELSRDVDLIQGNFAGLINVYAVPFGQTSNVPQCNLNMNNWTNAIFVGADCAVNGMSLLIPQRNYVEGDWIVINLNTSYPELSASNHMVYYGAFYSGSNPVDLVQQEVSNLDTNSGHITLYFRVYGSFNDNALNINGRTQILNANTTNGTVIVRVNSVSVYHERGDKDYTSILNEIKDNTANTPSAEENADAIAEKEQTATQDASDDASDAADENSTNQQTSNLIGILQNFLNAITNFSATNCNITLPFPNYAGGDLTVNICQNKDKAGNIIGVFTSLTMIVFYLPLAIKLLSMIYNEIRSFTNG